MVSELKSPAIHLSPLVKFTIFSLSRGENISKIKIQLVRIDRQFVLIKSIKNIWYLSKLGLPEQLLTPCMFSICSVTVPGKIQM